MIHPWTALRFVSDQIGFGVFATRPIPRGTITWVRDELDITVPASELRGLDPLFHPILDKYMFVDGRGDHVLCWDLGRYVNHSCRPTSIAPGWEFEIAVRDVAAGEQLTDDYGSLNVDESFVCACGEAECRKRILPDDPARLAPQWDRLIAQAFPSLRRVEQPLWPLVREKQAVEAALRGDAPIASSTMQWFRGARQA